MSTYGSRDKNPFIIPEKYTINGKEVQSNNGNIRYYLLVNSVSGEITIKTTDGQPSSSFGGNSTLDRTVGTIPKDGVFKPNPVPGSTTSSEIQYLTSAQGIRDTKNHAVITAEKAGAQNANQLIFPNSATPGAGQGQNQPPVSPSGSSGGTSSDPVSNPEEGKKLINDGITGISPRTEYGTLRYPEDIESTESDVIQFTMKSYGTRGYGEDLKFKPRNFNKKTEIKGSATLSIQPRISDQNMVTWNGSTMNPIQMGLANASLGFIDSGFAGTKETLNSLMSTIKGPEKGNIQTALKMAFAQEAIQTQNLLSRLTGSILNPNLELLFESPNLRTFNYTFQFSPRSQSEAVQVKKIIRFFKQGMAPQRTPSELFLKAPNVFDIKYLKSNNKNNEDHPYINKIKGPCALINCSVDYTPNGSYMTFDADSSMVSYILSLSFSELEPIYEDDYHKLDGNAANGTITQIGY